MYHIIHSTLFLAQAKTALQTVTSLLNLIAISASIPTPFLSPKVPFLSSAVPRGKGIITKTHTLPSHSYRLTTSGGSALRRITAHAKICIACNIPFTISPQLKLISTAIPDNSHSQHCVWSSTETWIHAQHFIQRMLQQSQGGFAGEHQFPCSHTTYTYTTAAQLFGV